MGFSNGWAEFAAKKPPPLVPSSLIASWEATGPPRRLWSPPAMVVRSRAPCRFCTTPVATSTIAKTNASGNSTRTTIRVRSTQKLPTVSVRARVKPRIRAATTAMPTAADTKFCTASPLIWTRCPTPGSPGYDCQSVLVTKATAVLNAWPPVIRGVPRESGSWFCRRRKPYRNSTQTAEKARTPLR
ncbi:hypothetical protein DC60_10310 [Streptomyces wadayamensis]|uniref:Uncharacterized protein n=1 Tax=Streptomyces wadayamensis TaxID=141454 RepID=A0ABR4SFA4_9ACTN|nr:hypothetical protein DC60_10310 [Streptomyces wadayamensis]